MNLKEAYSILEIPSSATPEEAKKKYRELTKKYHPDINKEPGAEDKFKKINEAYQVVSTGKGTDRQPQQPFTRDPFNPFGRQEYIQLDNIEISINISFKESVLGCKKDIKFNRRTKCPSCNGQGQFKIHNGCTKCGGRGQITVQQGQMVIIKTCDQCFGRAQIESCKECEASGLLDAEASASVNVPGGVVNGNVLRLSGMGHFAGSFGPFDQHTDVHLRVNVSSDPLLKIEGEHVIFNLELTLLEALKGCTKSVHTILGDKDIKIKPKSRNKDEVLIPNLGVNSRGSQKVILDIKYPDDVSSLIETLDRI